MTYQDAKEYLHIAENAYAAGAYAEATEILDKVAREVFFDKEMSTPQRNELIKRFKTQIALFQFCPDEGCWEDVCGLSDLLRTAGNE